MKPKPTIFRMLVIILVLALSLPVHGEWRFDPLAAKLKWAEVQPQVSVGGGWGYYAPAFRWTNDLRWRNDAAPTQPSYYKTQLRQRIAKDWWWGLAGRYAVAPTCDLRWAEVTLEKTLARPMALRVWGTEEWRRVNRPGGTLEDYDWRLFGSRLRWRPFPSFKWEGELTHEQKTYPSPQKSSVKTALSNEVMLRYAPHTILGRWAESVRVYPENAWKNYYYRSLRLEWQWNISNNAYFHGNYGYNEQSQGSGKTSGKLQITGILDYPATREYKLSWLCSGARTVVDKFPMPVEEEDVLPATDWRFGLRWQDLTPPFTLQVELFGKWDEGRLTGGWATRLQWHQRRFRWTLGLAPRGGFYPSAEKGYWLEVKYYLD